MQIAGLPVHPLVVHAAVVLVPLAALLVVAFAVWPRHRWATRWPAAALVVLALASVWAARLSGAALLADRPELAPLVQTHRRLGEMLSLVVTGFALLFAAGVWALGGPSALASGRGARPARGPAALAVVLPALLVLGAAVVLVAVVLAGDSGSRAVWG